MPNDETASTLSIVIPAYNERATIASMLAAVTRALPGVTKQVLVVDDCSTDGTREWLVDNIGSEGLKGSSLQVDDKGGISMLPNEHPDHPETSVGVIYRDLNQGKGAALRDGFRHVTGDVVVVQDADLEYDPADWERMWRLIVTDGVADVVYGSRFFGHPHRSLYFHHYIGNRLISFLFDLLFNQTLSDVEVCYKMIRREVLESMNLRKNDFGIEIEISAQIVLARRWRIYELGIHYYGRTYEEGKKINWKDGLKALFYLFALRIRSGLKPPAER